MSDVDSLIRLLSEAAQRTDAEREAEAVHGPRPELRAQPTAADLPPIFHIMGALQQALVGRGTQPSAKPQLKGVSREVVKAYRDFRKDVAKQPEAVPKTAVHARVDEPPTVFEDTKITDLFNRIMKGTWFHGAGKSAVMPIQKEGFDPKRVGHGMGTRIGEPHGVSLSYSPEAAGGFGTLLRAAPVVSPKSTLWPLDPKHQEHLKDAYTRAVHQVHVDPRTVLSSPGRFPLAAEIIPRFIERMRPVLESKFEGRSEVPLSEVLRELYYPMKQSVMSPGAKDPEFFRNLNLVLRRDIVSDVNKMLSFNLEKQGARALLYNPHRYNEYELRVFDPKNVVPLDIRSPYIPESASVPQRYIDKKEREVQEFLRAVPVHPSSLSEIYEKIPLERFFHSWREGR